MARRIAALALALILACVDAASGQAPATPVTVDYVGVEGIYLAVGADGGVSVGDTVDVFGDPEGASSLGRLVFTSVARRRSVGSAVDVGLVLGAGDVVYLRLVAPAEPGGVAEPGPPTPDAVAPGTARPRDPPVGVTGRLSLDLEMRETRTGWDGDLFGETRRRFATPTSRLSLQARNLPGGWELRTSLRASYRYADQPFSAPTTSVRAYSLEALRRYERVPIELRLGRFHNPHEAFGSYWDGALLRVGRPDGPGVGVAVGWEPDRFDEGVSTDVQKLTGFADFSRRGRGWAFDGDLSFHRTRLVNRDPRRHLGWSQRLTLGPLTLTHRLRYDEPSDTVGWRLGELRVRTAMRLSGALRLRASFDRSQPGGLSPYAPEHGWYREEASVGVLARAARSSLSLDGGVTRWGDGVRGRSVAASATTGIGRGLLIVGGRYWAREGSTSVAASPSLVVSAFGARTRLGYRFYRTEALGRVVSSHSGSAHVDADLTATLSAYVGAEQQWGAFLSGTRLRLGLRRTF